MQTRKPWQKEDRGKGKGEEEEEEKGSLTLRAHAVLSSSRIRRSPKHVKAGACDALRRGRGRGGSCSMRRWPCGENGKVAEEGSDGREERGEGKEGSGSGGRTKGGRVRGLLGKLARRVLRIPRPLTRS